MALIVGTTGADSLLGTGAADTLVGYGGNDVLDDGSGAGLDTLIGGAGNDIYYVHVAGATVFEVAGEGTDTIRTTLTSFTQRNNVENLVFIGTGNFTGTGNALDNLIVGANGQDRLSGEDGDDTLAGRDGDDFLSGGSGLNSLIGGLGHDVYLVTQATDSTIEYAGEGQDSVHTALSSFGLRANIEDLIYTGSGSFHGTGNGETNVLRGGSGNDTLQGLGGTDALFGGGGDDYLLGGTQGADTLIGGAGNDTYYVDVAGTAIIEQPGEGIDSVRSTLSTYTLGASLERLIFTGTGDANLTGNSGDTLIIGGNGNDTLRTMSGFGTVIGGAGNDMLFGGGLSTLVGGDGNDSYYWTGAGTSIVEAAGGGTDTLVGNVTGPSSYTLPANVENFAWVWEFASAASVIGNAENNIIHAGSGTPGSGDSILSGLDGNDTLSGGEHSNQMTGGNGNDVLIGSYYADGIDSFRYFGGETGMDTIQRFTSGTDKIALSNAYFTPTATVDYVAGSAATSANSTFLYDSATGLLSYDDDGTGAGAAIVLANLGTGLTLAAGDFIFF
jgi:Ca2+-binding RTX toxin-like protein